MRPASAGSENSMLTNDCLTLPSALGRKSKTAFVILPRGKTLKSLNNASFAPNVLASFNPKSHKGHVDFGFFHVWQEKESCSSRLRMPNSLASVRHS